MIGSLCLSIVPIFPHGSELSLQKHGVFLRGRGEGKEPRLLGAIEANNFIPYVC